MKPKPPSTVERLTGELLDRIRTEAWPAGSRVPGERVLMGEFGVSRLALREALAHLRALGVLDTAHGRGSVVRRPDATALGHLFPLLLPQDRDLTIGQMFELRLPLETAAAGLAAARRTAAEADEIDRLAAAFRAEMTAGDERAMMTDMEFHLAVARASHNPLFPRSLGAVLELVKHLRAAHLRAAHLPAAESEVVEGLHDRFANTFDCAADPARRMQAVLAHEAVAEAVRARDEPAARAAMEAHLRYSARHIRPPAPAAGA